jgi:hypothetical protein
MILETYFSSKTRCSAFGSFEKFANTVCTWFAAVLGSTDAFISRDRIAVLVRAVASAMPMSSSFLLMLCPTSFDSGYLFGFGPDRCQLPQNGGAIELLMGAQFSEWSSWRFGRPHAANRVAGLRRHDSEWA